MHDGRTMLGVNQVIPGVASILDEVQIEATFPDGTKLVTVHTPVNLENGDLALALYGSFLPVPNVNVFPSAPPPAPNSLDLYPPGFVFADAGAPIVLNQNKKPILCTVVNTADRPIQVGSHYHFVEANAYLQFCRRTAYGRRLNIASGTGAKLLGVKRLADDQLLFILV